MGLFSCFSPAELPPEQRDLIEMQKELQKVKHQLQEARSDAASARKTLTIAIQRIGSTPQQPSSPSAEAKDSPRIAASTAQSAPGTPTNADPQPKAVSNSGSTGSADGPAAGAAVRSSADAQDLHAQVLFLERQLHGSGANTMSGLQQSNQRLVQQMDALNVRLLEARQVGGLAGRPGSRTADDCAGGDYPAIRRRACLCMVAMSVLVTAASLQHAGCECPKLHPAVAAAASLSDQQHDSTQLNTTSASTAIQHTPCSSSSGPMCLHPPTPRPCCPSGGGAAAR